MQLPPWLWISAHLYIQRFARDFFAVAITDDNATQRPHAVIVARHGDGGSFGIAA